MQITTTYSGANATRGSRVTARVSGGDWHRGRRLTVPYDYAAVDPHNVAAQALLVKLGINGGLRYAGSLATGTVFDVVQIGA